MLYAWPRLNQQMSFDDRRERSGQILVSDLRGYNPQRDMLTAFDRGREPYGYLLLNCYINGPDDLGSLRTRFRSYPMA